MGKFVSYVLNWDFYVAPMLIAPVLKDAPIWYALPIIGAVMVIAAFSWSVLTVCRRHGGDLIAASSRARCDCVGNLESSSNAALPLLSFIRRASFLEPSAMLPTSLIPLSPAVVTRFISPNVLSRCRA